ncbi:hypothetical protein COCOBI_10-5930 [Coccomyxa sp. Obi]|nr:hypothetical protein COCOBI_10-5930 [Coccomyxa sp. Obi]
MKQVERSLGVARQRNDTLESEAQLQDFKHRHLHRRQHSRDPDEPNLLTSTSYKSGTLTTAAVLACWHGREEAHPKVRVHV